jgi:hypothetical protein
MSGRRGAPPFGDSVEPLPEMAADLAAELAAHQAAAFLGCIFHVHGAHLETTRPAVLKRLRRALELKAEAGRIGRRVR